MGPRLPGARAGGSGGARRGSDGQGRGRPGPRPRRRLLALALAALLPHAAVSPPSAAALPDTTLVSCDTTKGTIKVEVHPAWAPIGAARFLELVTTDYFNDVAL